MKRGISILLSAAMALSMAACGQSDAMDEPETSMESSSVVSSSVKEDILENFVLVKGGVFQMGSPEDEAWRSEDETCLLYTSRCV